MPPGKISKVIVCGAKSCGKTSVLEQLINGSNPLTSERYPTIEDTYSASIDNDRGVKEKIRFFDTAGFDGTVELPKSILPFADGFVIVFALNNRRSFLMVNEIKNYIEKHKEKKEVAITVLGNKADLRDREIDSASLHAWMQKEKVKYFEVSATDRKSLIDPFIYLTSKMNPPPSKSSFPQLGKKGKSGSIALEL